MIGTRVWMRMRRTWGILPRVARPSSNSSSSNINGSPPLRITSEMLRSRAIASFHVAHLRGLSSASVCNSWRRKQNRQWTLHEWFAIISALPWNFRISPGGPVVARSPIGSHVNPSTWQSSSFWGRIWVSSGSVGQCLLIRSTNGRGTRRGYCCDTSLRVGVGVGKPTASMSESSDVTLSARTSCHSAVELTGRRFGSMFFVEECIGLS